MTQSNINSFPAADKPFLFNHFVKVAGLSYTDFDMKQSTLRVAADNKVVISSDTTNNVAMVEMKEGTITIETCNLARGSSTKALYHADGNTQLFNDSVASEPVNRGARYVAGVRSSVERLLELAR